MHELDENQDGIFDRSELRVLLTKFSTATENKITEIIELLDDDKSGELDMGEFRNALGDFLHGMDDAEFAALAETFDAERVVAASTR